jgi:hypothetical protein
LLYQAASRVAADVRAHLQITPLDRQESMYSDEALQFRSTVEPSDNS